MTPASKSHSSPRWGAGGNPEQGEWSKDASTHSRLRAAVMGMPAERDLDALIEQFDAVERVANAAKMYRDVRSDYSWVQMIQALDAWEHPPVTNPASTSEAREGGDDA